MRWGGGGQLALRGLPIVVVTALMHCGAYGPMRMEACSAWIYELTCPADLCALQVAMSLRKRLPITFSYGSQATTVGLLRHLPKWLLHMVGAAFGFRVLGGP